MIIAAESRALMLDCTLFVHVGLVPPPTVKIYNLCNTINHTVHKAFLPFSVSWYEKLLSSFIYEPQFIVHSVVNDAAIPVLNKIRRGVIYFEAASSSASIKSTGFHIIAHRFVVCPPPHLICWCAVREWKLSGDCNFRDKS